MKKKTRKSKAAKSMRDLPAKALNAKTAKGVKGGGKSKGSDAPTESISFNYGKIDYKY